MSGQDNYQLLVQKLDQFIRKYYINRLLKGGLYSTGLILGLFLVSSLSEYFFFFSTIGRKLLFYSFLGVSVSALGYWVFDPLLRYFRLGKVISHEQAASIIGDHFFDVKDKLLNILQLKQQLDVMAEKDLILASINQKSEEIKPLPFKSAINLGQNKRYLRYALPPLLLLLFILLAAPNVLQESTHRLIYNSKEFFRPAPFSFSLDAESLQTIQYADFLLQVQVEGTQLPNEVFLELDGYQYRLTKEGPANFSYLFKNVREDFTFRLHGAGVESEKFALRVLKKPNLTSFEVTLDYPDYTGRKDEKFENIGDVLVPQGTRISWVFNARHTESIRLKFAENTVVEAKQFGDDLFSYAHRAFKDEPYSLLISNKALPKADSVQYSITVIPDQYPAIRAEKFADSANVRVQYFAGDCSDDYGIKSITFNYRIVKSGGTQEKLVQVPLAKPDNRQASFQYTFDMGDIGLNPGDEVVYFFEVSDNDAVNGSKSSRTNLMTYAMPTIKELEAMVEKNDAQIKENLKEALAESRKVQQQMKKMREKLLQEKELSWQNRKELEKLLNRQKELQEQIEEAKKAFQENQENQEQISEQNEELQQKEEQLQALFEETMSEEMQELMQQLEELLQKMEKEDALEMMEQFQAKDKQMEMNLDRLLELFKQLEVEQELNQAMEKLSDLGEKQEQLSEETKKGEKSQEALKEQQDQIDKEFQEFKKQLEQIENKNEKLENPKDIGDSEEETKDIQRDLNDSKMNLEQQKNNKAAQSQKNASDKMKDMANAMQMQMQAGEMQQMMEDMQTLRQLLENLVGLSFDQEDLVKKLDRTEINTPRYVELVQEQFKIKDDFKIVEDSLQALSKRVFQIESFITGKLTEVQENMRQGLDDLEERKKFQAADHQQRTMKSINDLALMLSEIMNQMQQQMSMMMSGSQMCSNPQSGGKPQDKISEGQQKLNNDMRQMKERMQQGKGEGASAKEFAQMAARQAAMRKALQEKQRKLQEQGKGSKQLQELIDQMDKTEIDLVNKQLTNDLMKRQQDILSRLLEHENAERQQEYDEQRKAQAARELQRKMPPALEEYIRKRKAEVEQYKTVSPTLKPYYKSLVEGYFQTLKGGEK